MSELRIDIQETQHAVIVRLAGEAAHRTADALQMPLARVMA